MASVAMASHHHHQRHHSGFGSHALSAAGPTSQAPVIEMLPNPDFSFPTLPRAPSMLNSSSTPARRPVSMHVNVLPPNASIPHRRTVSNLPSFNFNSTDTSGLNEAGTPPMSPRETEARTPSRNGHHRRNESFLAGGDSRLGVQNAINSSPTKSATFQLSMPSPGPPNGQRGHRHRRSAAISNHDVSSITRPSDPEPRVSTSLPTTPMEHSDQASPLDRVVSEPLYPTFDHAAVPLDASARPSSRRVVEFADVVDVIPSPRPLSTISSDTESSPSTVRGHSVNNSISSMLNPSVTSHSSARHHRTPSSVTFQHEPEPRRSKSSMEISKQGEKEGELLEQRPFLADVPPPVSDTAVLRPSLTSANRDSAVRSGNPHKRHSLSHALRLDRRKSEPLMSMKASDLSRLSSISLQDDIKRVSLVSDGKASRSIDRKSSTRKFKDWAVSKIGRRAREAKFSSEEADAETHPTLSHDVTEPSVPHALQPAEIETDLDAVFGSPDLSAESQRLHSSTRTRFEISTPTASQSGSFHSHHFEDASQMVDLDAALGPFQTPSLGGPRQRRELHSSRLTKDFGGPGMHYHRRAESLPALPAFEFRATMASQTSMDDVLEEDGEEGLPFTESVRPRTRRIAQPETSGIGIQVVDADDTAQDSPFNLGASDSVRAQPWVLEPERPTTSHGNFIPRLSTPILERRPSSIIEETIMEESSPVETLEIVEAHEEPRASSLTKSSDSSETPTLLAAPSDPLDTREEPPTLLTPETYQTTTFSTPEYSRRQSSFDASRVGTSASSIADIRTVSSCTTGGDPGHDTRLSVDDPVPSLTSSRSTMVSTMHANTSRREFSGERTPSLASATQGGGPPVIPTQERSRKRASIHSFSQLMGGSFSGRSKAVEEVAARRPQTAVDETGAISMPRRKENRLKKLMFWRSKDRIRQAALPR